jgi:hypothetical protein
MAGKLDWFPSFSDNILVRIFINSLRLEKIGFLAGKLDWFPSFSNNILVRMFINYLRLEKIGFLAGKLDWFPSFSNNINNIFTANRDPFDPADIFFLPIVLPLTILSSLPSLTFPLVQSKTTHLARSRLFSMINKRRR